MTNYNDGKWHGWNGGDCPVHPETVVQITYTTGMDEIHVESKFVDWDDGVIAFRVIKEHKEPREWKLYVDKCGNAQSWCNNNPEEFEAVTVREVLE